MVKPKVGRDGSRRNIPRASAAQAEGSSTPNESKSKNDKELAKKVSEEQKRNIKVKEEPEDITVRVTRSTTKVAKGQQKFKDSASDTKNSEQSANHSSTTETLGGTKKEVISEVEADVPKTKSLVDTDSKRVEKLYSKPGQSNKASACASPLPAHMNVFNPRSRLFQTPKRVITDKQKRSFDSSATKAQKALSSETKKQSVAAKSVDDKSKPVLQCSKASKGLQESSEKKTTEEKSSVVESMHALQYSKDTDEEEFSFYLKPSKVQQKLSSGSEKKTTELNTVRTESKLMLLFSKDKDHRQLNLDLKDSKGQQKLHSENAKKAAVSNTEEIETENEIIIESKADECESTPMLQCAEIVIGQHSLDLKDTKVQQEFSSGNEEKVSETNLNEDESTHPFLYPMPSKAQQNLFSESEKKATVSNTEGNGSKSSLECSTVIGEQLTMDLKDSEVHQEFSENEEGLTESRFIAAKPMLELQHSKDADRGKINLDLKVSEAQQEFTPNNETFESNLKDIESTPMLQCSKDIAEQLSLNLKDAKVQQELTVENEEKSSETKFDADESVSEIQYSNCTGKWQPNLDLMPSKAQKNLFSGSKKKATVLNTEENEAKSPLECSKDIGEHLSLDLKDFKVPQEISSKDEEKVSEAKLDPDESTPTLENYNNLMRAFCNAPNERISDLDLMPLNEQQNAFSENEKKATDSNTEGNDSAPTSQYSKDIHERLLNLDLKASKEHQELSSENVNKSTELITKENESTSLLDDSKLIDINEEIQNFNLNVSNNLKDTSEHQDQLSEQKTEEREETINGGDDDINICFEVDTPGNEDVLVVGEEQYAVDESRTKTFNFGEGMVIVSFTDNQVNIFTHKADIDCSIRKNRVAIKFIDNVTNSNSTPEGSADQVSECEDIAVFQNHDGIKIAGAQEESSLIRPPSAEMVPESGSENVYMPESKTDSSFVPNVVQGGIQRVTANFLSKIMVSCDEYNKSFIECLNQGNVDTK